MNRFVAVLIMCVGLLPSSYGRDFKAAGASYGYSFSEINGWVGIGQDFKTFPQADMVFYAAEWDGEDVKIRYPYTDVYIYTNATRGTPEEFSKILEAQYKKGSPNLKVVHTKDIQMSSTLVAKVTYYINISADNKAQAVASISRQGVFVSLVMQAKSEKILKKNLPDFEKLLLTYKELDVVNDDK
jgi:hypothetical protein